jgi:serine/threonine protein kinase
MPEVYAQEPAPAAPSKYQILMELGKGGMGVVYLAMSRGPKGFVKLVVLKMLRRQLLGEEECHKMFMEEARVSARLNHPNIVQIFEVTDIEDAPTMVMEYLEGQTLSAILANREFELPVPLALHVVARTLAGLHAAHELRDYDGTHLHLIHRDVSPHNIFVLFDGRVKVLDFGIAKAADSEVETKTGELKGKIRYMAPEQILRDPQDRRVDIFAVGVMLWELLARRRMWAGKSDGEIVRALLHRSIPPFPPDPSIPESLVAICNRALAADPEERYPTAHAFEEDIDRYLRDLPEGRPTDATLAAWTKAHFGAASESARRVIESHIKAADRTSGSGPAWAGNGAMPGVAPAPLTTTRLRAVMPPLEREEGETRVLPRSPEPPEPSQSRPRAAELPSPPTLTLAAAPATALAPAVAAASTAGHAFRNMLLLISLAVGASGLVVALFQRGQAATSAPLAETTASPCPSGFKRCDGQCVSIDRPDYGCGSESCTPCRPTNATPRCNQQHACDIAICYQSYDDCDGSNANGCEADVRTDPDHCGSCTHRCPDMPHAQRGCGDVCTIWRCEEGFRDCNGATADGCEIDARSDPKHCGRCDVACAAGHACRNGHCTP